LRRSSASLSAPETGRGVRERAGGGPQAPDGARGDTTSGAPLRVLLVDSSPRLGELVMAALGETEEGRRFEVSRARSVHAAGESVGRDEADVVLLPLDDPDAGLLPFVELRAEAPAVPVVVLSSAADEPLAMKAVQLGATDYLRPEQLYGTLVVRCLQHAVESARVRAQLGRYEEALPALLADLPSEGRVAPLRVALPRPFEELVGAYAQILDQAVEQVLYRVEHPLQESLRRVARRAGELRAGPRDVVEIHAAAMRGRQAEAGPQRMRLYVAEGRVRVLELMGHLVTYYRHLSQRGRTPTPGA
jgi:CheY-like chemotaxis protein